MEELHPIKNYVSKKEIIWKLRRKIDYFQYHINKEMDKKDKNQSLILKLLDKRDLIYSILFDDLLKDENK